MTHRDRRIGEASTAGKNGRFGQCVVTDVKSYSLWVTNRES